MKQKQSSVPVSSSDRFTEELNIRLNAGVGVVFVRTREPFEVIDLVRNMSLAEKETVFKSWTMTTGWSSFDRANAEREPTTTEQPNPLLAMQMVHTKMIEKTLSFPDDGYYCMMWTHFALKGSAVPPLIQQMAECARVLPNTGKRIILVMPPEFEIPKELEDSIPIIDHLAPTASELRVAYDTAVGSLPDEQRPGFSEEDITAILHAGMGMTMLEFESACTCALIEHRLELPGVDIDKIVASVSKMKTEVVKRSEVLEVMPVSPMSDVGGLDNLKTWMRARRHAFSDEARDMGVDRPKGIALIGPPGCLSGDTLMSYRRGERHSGRDITLEKLYLKFNGLGGGKPWDLSLPTYLHSHDADTGKVLYNRVVKVIDAGVKPVVLLSTEGGRQLKLTADHPVLTEDGYTPAGELSPGAEIIVRGSMKPTSSAVTHGRKPRVVVEGLKFYTSGWDKFVVDQTTSKEYRYKRQHRARLVVEAHLNKLEYDAYVHALKTDPLAIHLQTLPDDVVVHHLDENPMNDTLSNLQVLFKEEHDRLHTDEGNFNVEYTALDTVTTVEPYGSERTYDIQMAVPCNNFATADGLLVHNTGKSLAAKATASELRLPLIRFDVSRVFAGIVGASESRVRAALKMLDALSPAVVLLDEVDKAFNMNTGGGDSGVGSRVLGAILTHMQETEAPLFWVMTANRTAGLPPELLRKGRLDEVFSVTLPASEEREAIFAIHLNKRGWPAKDVKDLSTAINRSQNYVPAELEAAVKECITNHYAAWKEGGGTGKMPPITGQQLAQQFEHMRPLSEAFAVQFREMQIWAQNNARPASNYDAPEIVAEETARTRERSPTVSAINPGQRRTRSSPTEV